MPQEREYEVEIIRTVHATVRVTAASAAAIRRALQDDADSLGDDILAEAMRQGAPDGHRVVSITPIR